MPDPLTERQAQILRFIQKTLEETAMAPSFREIAREFGITYGTVQSHLEALKKKGALEESRLKHRGLVPLEWKPTVQIPLIGEVRAGLPVLAEQNIESYLSVDRDLARGARLFALRVKGDSMKDASILPGDTVIVRQQETAQNGDIVVAFLDGEATVKYYRLRHGEVILEPANAAYEPIPARDFSIVGKVVGLVRSFGAR
jgi:repressor LexA